MHAWSWRHLTKKFFVAACMIRGFAVLYLNRWVGFEYDAASLCYFIHHGPNALFISMFLYLVYVNPPILDLTAARNISHCTALPQVGDVT
jgi:hypothetical protein